MQRSGARIAILAAGAAIAAALVFSVIRAQPSGDAEIRKAFEAADANRDGVMDANEYVANTIYLFNQMDTDRDGYISLQEWSAGHRGRSSDSFKAADRNGDGKLSVGEAVGDKMIDYVDIDANHDGVIAVDELLAYERKVLVASARK